MSFTLIVLIHINYYEYIAVEWVIIGQALYVIESITAKCRSLTARRGTSIKTLHDNRKKNHYPQLICSSNIATLSISCTLRPYQINYPAYSRKRLNHSLNLYYYNSIFLFSTKTEILMISPTINILYIQNSLAYILTILRGCQNRL